MMKYFTYSKVITPEIKSVIEHNKNQVHFTVFTSHEFNNSCSAVAPLIWLRDNPKSIWVAPNVLIFKIVDFEMINRMAYFLGNHGKPSLSVIFGNNDRPLFSDVLKNANHTMDAAQIYVGEKKYRVGLIPRGYFKIKPVRKIKES